ncbi:hypothetical protein P154DRAFT_523764 [Amniculicola lignicola CBS 123094]|uniref:Secreted protein n=1 Tax=Amniculicola lignicola CBS 123094 TaxID=1392246 RepID=A0A6A5WMW8_9PLEO|nr:hypothetical protein P154DRAFT_523764 [Amniculicola lignicola CBS 123094]
MVGLQAVLMMILRALQMVWCWCCGLETLILRLYTNCVGARRDPRSQKRAWLQDSRDPVRLGESRNNALQYSS